MRQGVLRDRKAVRSQCEVGLVSYYCALANPRQAAGVVTIGIRLNATPRKSGAVKAGRE